MKTLKLFSQIPKFSKTMKIFRQVPNLMETMNIFTNSNIDGSNEKF